MKNKIERYAIDIAFIALVVMVFLMIYIGKSQAQTPQDQIPQPGRIFSGITAPTGVLKNYSLSKDIYCDTVAHQYYISKVAGIWKTTNAYGNPGANPTFSIGTVSTLPAGSSATASVTGTIPNFILNLGIPKGNTGATGSGSGTDGWVSDLVTSPDKYGALHSNTTIAGAGHNQAWADSAFAGTGAVTTDNMDWAAWQMAVSEGCSTGKKVIAYGHYYVNKSIQVDKYFITLSVDGNNCVISTTNTNSFAVFGRPDPTNNADAKDLMESAVVIFKDVSINANTANQNQTGIELGPTYSSTYDGIRVVGLRTGIHLRFALNTTIQNCWGFGLDSAFTADMGNWPDANNFNSQSNVTTFSHCRVYCYSTTASNALSGPAYGYGVFASSGCRITDCIVEGIQVMNAIKYDAMGSPNVYNFWVQNIHVECSFDSSVGTPSTSSNSLTTGSKTFTIITGITVPTGYPVYCSSPTHGYMSGTVTSYNSGTGALVVNVTSVDGGSGGPYTNWNISLKLGCTESAIKIRGLAGIFELNGAYGQFASILVDAEGTSSNFNVKVSNVYSWVPMTFGGVYKLYRSRNTNQAWLFDWNDAQYTTLASAQNNFITDAGYGGTTGVAVTNATLGTVGNGNSRYAIIPSPR